MRRTLSLLIAVVTTLLLAGCSGSVNEIGIRGEWVGTADFGEGGTRTVAMKIQNRAGIEYASKTLLFLFSLTEGTECEVEVNYGHIKPLDDGTVEFPIKTVGASPCFPPITASELEDGGQLQLVLTGKFVKGEDGTKAGEGTIKLQTSRNGTVLTIYLEGTWTMTSSGGVV